MSEDWNAIAAEVDEAIRSVADVSQGGGYPATLRTSSTAANPSDSPTPPVYALVHVIEGNRDIFDKAQQSVVMTKRTLLISATGPAPQKKQAVAIGITPAQVTLATQWEEIEAVRPLSPVGIAVLYEVDLVG